MTERDPARFRPTQNRWRMWRQLLVAVAVLTALGYAILAMAPRVVTALIPAEWWTSYGVEIESAFAEGADRCSSPAGDAALSALAARLAGEGAAFSLAVYDIPILNAWALPGRRIVLTGKLLDAASGPDEVAGVLAHEIGHARERHAEMSLVREIGIGTLLGLGSSNGLSGTIAVLRYSREAEREADAIAARLMIDARVDTAALVRFFEVLKRSEGDASAGFLWSTLDMLSTHPITDERIAAVPPFPKERSAAPALDSAQWDALKNICR